MEDARANVIECPCGVLLEGESSDDVAAKAQVHAKETHDMDLSYEQALAMARPA
jgi:predicted small metal-binding protein